MGRPRSLLTRTPFLIPIVLFSVSTLAALLVTFAGGIGSYAQQLPLPRNSPSPSPIPAYSIVPAGQRLDFEAVLTPVNSNAKLNDALRAIGQSPVDGRGRAHFVMEGAFAGAFIEIEGLTPGTAQMQFIRNGTCPGPNADLNGDGYVDIIEAAGIPNPIRLPLDLGTSNTAFPPSMFPPISSFPVTGEQGRLTYITSQPAALWSNTFSVPSGFSSPSPLAVFPPSPLPLSPSPTSTQTIAANLQGLVVEITGVPSNLQLPSSVQSLFALPNTATLPVACGVITFIR